MIGVFGANGFIGRNIVSRLIASKRPAIAFGRSFPPDYEAIVGGSIEKRVIDFADVLATHAALQDLTSVIHLINSSSPAVGNSRVAADLAANVLPSVNFIESCLLTGVSRFVFVSSGGTVYGEPRFLPIDESHPTVPINSYGLTKLVLEQYLAMLSRESAMSTIVLRVANPFGPGQTLKKGQGLIASILKSHSLDLPITLYGDGSVLRDYLYIDDLCDALVAALDCPAMHETINIGSGIGRSVLDVLAAAEVALGDRVAVQFATSRATDTKANILDCGKAAALLGWTPKTDFGEAMRLTVAAWS